MVVNAISVSVLSYTWLLRLGSRNDFLFFCPFGLNTQSGVLFKVNS